MAADGAVYQCRETFLVRLNGHDQVIPARATVREGHPLLASYPHNFDLQVVDYEWSQPEPPAPPEPRTSRTRSTAARSDDGKGDDE